MSRSSINTEHNSGDMISTCFSFTEQLKQYDTELLLRCLVLNVYLCKGSTRTLDKHEIDLDNIILVLIHLLASFWSLAI